MPAGLQHASSSQGLISSLGAGLETEQDPVGLLVMEAFPLFLVCRAQTPASVTFPESQRADSNSC